MPAQSKAQQKFMGMVHALKKGDMKPSDASKDVKDAAKSMSKKDAEDFASTKHKGLPRKIKQEIARRLRDEGKLAGTMVGSYAIPSKAKKRKHGDSDNLGIRKKKGNSGQPDIEEGGSFQRGSHRKPPAPFGGLNHHILNKSSVRKHDDDANFPKKDSGHEDLDEAKVETERYFGKKGIIIMIRDGNKMISAIFKDKKNADKFNRNKPADVKKLLQLAKKTKYPKAIDESVNEAKDEVTPQQLSKIQKDIKKINRKIKVYISKHPIRKGKLEIELGSDHPFANGDDREISKIDKVLKKHTGTHRIGTIFLENVLKNHDGKAAPYGSGYKKVDEDGKEISDKNYAQWKKSNKLKEWFSPNLTEEKINELGVFPIKNYLKGIFPKKYMDSTTPQKKERMKSIVRDLINTLNDYWKSHKIPYRVTNKF